ncbi:MAG: UbiD family decarboxylase [Candidatus Brockarchaeota archaeon]|nr:UbiD family decarboxylase [Candidatus Brockarchaeota archaeon]
MDEEGEVEKVASRVERRFEAAAMIKEKDPGKALLFLSVGEHGRKVVANVFGERGRLSRALGAEEAEVHRRLLGALGAPVRCKEVSDPAFREVKLDELKALPVLTHYEKDAGPYVTSATVVARDPDTGVQNASIHRLLAREGYFVVRMVEGRHLHQIFQKYKARGTDMPVAAVITPHPAVTVAAASPAPAGLDELHVAGALVGEPLEIVRLERSGLDVPAEAEYVIEGLVSVEKTEKEWMTDILGTYDLPREQPVVRVTGLHRSEDPLYHAILPAGSEHRLLMGLPFEARILDNVERIGVKVVGICLTRGSGSWLHAAISIRKRSEGDGKNAILAALSAHPSLKGVTILDEDIDPNDYEAIDFSLATRFQGGGNVVVVEGARGSSLDPSADQGSMTTMKWGIDATLGLSADKGRFEKAKIPGLKRAGRGGRA